MTETKTYRGISKARLTESGITADQLDAHYASAYLPSLGAAKFNSGNSIDNSTRVGALIWRVDVGPNGELHSQEVTDSSNRFPDGVNEADTKRWHDRSWKYKLVGHSETLALTKAAREGLPVKDLVMSVTHHPCYTCAATLVEAGVGHMVMEADAMQGEMAKRYAEQFSMSRRVMENAGLEIHAMNLKKGAAFYDPLDRELKKHKERVAQKPDTPIFYNHQPPRLKSLQSKYTLPAQQAEWYRAHSPLEENKQGAVVFDAAGNELLGAFNRPPVGTNPDEMTEEERQAFALSPERIIMAHAARDGVSLEGRDMYTTYHPRGQGAVVIVASGIKEIFIDPQCLQAPMLDENNWKNEEDEEKAVNIAKDIWAAKVMFEEAGVRVTFVNQDPDKDPYEHIHKILGQEAIRVQNDIHHQCREAIVQIKGNYREQKQLREQHQELDIDTLNRDQLLEINPDGLSRASQGPRLDFRLETNIDRSTKPGPLVYIPRQIDLNKKDKTDVGYLCYVREHPAPVKMTFREFTEGEKGRTFAFAGGYRNVEDMKQHMHEIYGDRLKPDSVLQIYVTIPVRPLRDSEVKQARSHYSELRANDPGPEHVVDGSTVEAAKKTGRGRS